VVEYKKGSKPQHDIILGTETMEELGIMVDFKAKSITVDEVILPMRNINHLQGASTLYVLKLNNSLAMEQKSTQEATKCATWILDAKYSKADLQSIVKDNYKHLSTNQQKKFLQFLMKHELLFNGTLCDWRTKPVSFLLKEGASPYHGQAFPVPKIHKDTLIKEVERLCKLGVLEQQQPSEQACHHLKFQKRITPDAFLAVFGK
jgi:hypothetical protein